MRIYNGKNCTINVPLPNGDRLVIESKSISKDFMPSNQFLVMVKSSFDYNEIALIVSGITEMNMCSSESCIMGFVVNTVAEAVERFMPKSEPEVKEVVIDATPEKEACVFDKPASLEELGSNPAFLSPEREEAEQQAVEEFKKNKKKK